MAAAADGDGQPVVTAKIYGGNHIRHIGAACDQQRPFVDRGVVEPLEEEIAADLALGLARALRQHGENRVSSCHATL